MKDSGKYDSNITAALSFKSIKELDKSYSKFFEGITVGYECEIAVGELEGESENREIDYEYERRVFEEDFNWGKGDYLNKLSTNDNLSANEILEKFEITAIQGRPDKSYLSELFEILKVISKNGYRVVGLPMLNQDPIMEEPSLDNYASYNVRQAAEEFATRDTRLINVDLAIKKAEEAHALMAQIQHRYTLEGVTYAVDITINSYLLVGAGANTLKNTPAVRTDEVYARRLIYKIGDAINKYVLAWNDMYQIAIGTKNSDYFLVFNEQKNINILDATKYDINGLLSPLLEWSENGKEHFEEDYAEELQSVEEVYWQNHLESVREDNDESDTKETTIKTIHRCVVEDVDSLAKYSDGYHGREAEKYKGKYTVVESDSSIKPAGAEVVSIVFEGIKPSFIWLEKVFDMIEERGMETNKSTGLHVNIGTFRSFSRTEEEEANLGNPLHSEHPVIDVLKLAVLSGDHYLLEQFGRFGNEYAKSLASNIRDLATYNFDLKIASKKGELFSLLRELNKTFIRNQSMGEDARYRTVNMQHLLDKGYLEFRIAGGKDYHVDRLKVRKAIYRYAQLCAIACDPKAYFKEYMLELYKRFVDRSGPAVNTNIGEPRPKNAFEAMYYLRAWNSKHQLKRENKLDKFNKIITNDIVYKNEIDLVADMDNFLEILSMMDSSEYKYVNTNILYSIRLVMLKLVDLYKDNPKQYLSNFYRTREEHIKDVMAPKLYRLKRNWVKYIFTGTGTESITAMNKADRDKASVEVNKFKHDLRAKGKYSDRDIDGILGAYLSSRGEGKNDKQAREEAMKEVDKSVEASDTYTNKSKNVKLIYYANRSTPQTCKPGATVKAKAGYGKRTSIKNATPEQVKQLKAGKWVRDREDGRKHNDKGAKTSKYRPQLAKKQKDARKRKMAASDTPANKFKAFVEEVFSK